jgi:uncharacterized protein YndB with AHSA1/START domain
MSTVTSKQKVETNGAELTFTREFDAPRKLVFETYSDCKHLQNWWGPRSWPLSYCKMDFRAEGKWHFCMKGPDGTEAWGLAVYKVIKAPEKIHFEDYFSDKDGKPNKDMPYTTIQVDFIEKDGKTIVKSVAKYSNKEDLQKVIDMGMIEGMTETYDRLEEYLPVVK